MPQAVQRVFVTVTVTNDASQIEHLIELIDVRANCCASHPGCRGQS
jgi:hypothetical protein